MASSKKRETVPKVDATTAVPASTQDQDAVKATPLYDPKDLLEQVRIAVANGGTDPRPEHFCYVDISGNIVKITIATGEKEIIGHINNDASATEEYIPDVTIEIVRQQLIDEALEDGNVLAARRFASMSPASIVSYVTHNSSSDIIYEMAENIILNRMDGPGYLNLDWILNCMPNGMVFDCKTGAAANPDYVIITANQSLFMIEDLSVAAMFLDNGIARFDHESRMFPFDLGMSITDKINCWNYTMGLEDHDFGSCVIGCIKVPSAICTKHEVAKRGRMLIYRLRQTLSATFECMSDAFDSLAMATKNGPQGSWVPTVNIHGASITDDIGDDDKGE